MKKSIALKLTTGLMLCGACALTLAPASAEADGWRASVVVTTGGGYRAPCYEPPRPAYCPPHRSAYHAPRPVFHSPRPVFHEPRPVFHEPRPVFHGGPAYCPPPRVIYRPAPVYYRSPLVVGGYGDIHCR